jgi:adenylate kinase
MEKGALVPDEVTIQMLLERIVNSDCQKGFLLDGFPRTLAQANSLDQALSVQRIQLDVALAIDVSESELVRRLGGRLICRSCQVPYHQFSAPPKTEGLCDRCGGDLYQRDDDKPESVAKRIRVYQEQTYPLIEYYENQSKLCKIDGEQPMDVVAKALEAALGA